jgi:hypothetical protein
MFEDISRIKRKTTTQVFERFAMALRDALSETARIMSGASLLAEPAEYAVFR